MPTVTIATPQIIAFLQEVSPAFAKADSADEAAVAAKFDPEIAAAKSALDKVTAERDQALADLVTARKARDLTLAASIQSLTSGQPVPIELPDAASPAAPATE